MPRFSLFGLILLTLLAAGCTTYNRNSEGLKYFNQSKYDQALYAFQAALAENPNDPNVYYNIGLTYYQSAKISQYSGQTQTAAQQADLAEQYYRQCLSRDANHAAAYRGLAVLYMERQQPSNAFSLLLGWAQSNPTSIDARIELARLYQEFAQICQLQGRTDDAKTCQQSAVDSLQSALSIDPNNYRALRAIGYLREQAGQTAQAISDYQRSLASNPAQQDLAARVAMLTNSYPVNPVYPATPTYPTNPTYPTQPSTPGAVVYPGTTTNPSTYGSITSGASTYDSQFKPTYDNSFGRTPF